MKKINDIVLMNEFILKNKIDEIFSNDMKPFMELLIFKKNEYICRENEELKYLLFFVDGKAKVYTTLSNGKSLLLCFYEGFRILGDLEIVNPQMASTNVQVIKDAYCIGISTENVRNYLLNDAKFLRIICSSLSEKLNRSSKNSSINLLYPLENRLASYIIATGERTNSNGKEIIIFNENLTEISDLLGTSYRHLLRTLSALCKKGAIRKCKTFYEVRDENELKNLAADLYIEQQ